MEYAREENAAYEHVEDIAPLLGLPEVYCFSRPKAPSPTHIRRWPEVGRGRCIYCFIRSEQIRESDTLSIGQTSGQVTLKGKEPIRQTGSEQGQNEEANEEQRGRKNRLLRAFQRSNAARTRTERSRAQTTLKSRDSSGEKAVEDTKEQEQEPTQRERTGWLSTWDTFVVALSYGAVIPI